MRGGGSLTQVRAELAQRLEARRAEIEEAALTRVHSIANPNAKLDSAYLAGLKAALTAAVEYGLESIERGDEPPPPVPVPLLAQARVAARSGVDLGTVLRRYFAGYTLLGDFVVEEAEATGVHGVALKDLLRGQALRFDRMVAAVTEEYGREALQRPASSAQRRAELVRGLLAGERLDALELGYEFAAHHVGIAAIGRGGEEAVRELVQDLDCRLLLVRSEEDVHWAWLGSRSPLDPERIGRALPAAAGEVAVAHGEPAEGVHGWRLTHRQSVAALPIAQRQPGRLVRYAEVALTAGVIHDDLLVTSLSEIYLAPLRAERDGGTVLRKTLRAYFAHDRNASSTAAALAVNRNTVASRLAVVEERIGRPLTACGTDLEVALTLDELDRSQLT